MPTNPAYATPGYTKSPVTGPQLAANNIDAVRMLWAKTANVNEDVNDFWKEFEGAGPASLIQTVTDLSKGAGQSIRFTKKSGFYGEPHLGDERFHDSSHYEDLRTSTDDLKVGWFRHGTEVTEHAEEFMGMRDELANGFPEAQGAWLGRTKSERIFMMLRELVPTESRMSTKQALNFRTIIDQGQTMRRNAATAAHIGTTARGESVKGFVLVAVNDALTSLKHDSDYIERLKHADDRGMKNCIFTGGYTHVDGHIIKPYDASEHDGYGATGSPFNPLGRLAIEIRSPTAGNGANAITSTAGYTPLSGSINANAIVLGGVDYDPKNALVKPSKWFPNFAYRYSEYTTMNAGTTPFYVAIVNPPDVNNVTKFGLYRCVANDGVALQITGVWVASADVGAAGAGPQKLADFAVSGFTTPVFDGNKHTTAHPVGSQVVLVDPDAVPVFTSVMLGANAMRRGYGKYRNQRATETAEGEFIKKLWVKSVFGQSLVLDRLQRARSVMQIRHRGVYSSMPLPGPA
jgi:hypothetical protein